MAVKRYREMKVDIIPGGAQRRLGFTDNLMMVIIDFDHGPQLEPDPPHSHPHEQVSYVADGEIYFFLEDQRQQLGPGDMFMVPQLMILQQSENPRVRGLMFGMHLCMNLLVI